MRVKIYQVNPYRDTNHVKFLSTTQLQELLGSDKIDPTIYDEVFNAEVDEMGLEDLYAKFNSEYHPLFRGHSLSMSDVVCMQGKAYFCDFVGFQEIPFDETKTQKPENLMRILYVEPHKPPYEAEIPDTLEAEQKAVGGGLIEPIYMGDGVILVGNEESKLLGMEGNRYIPETDSIMAGSFFICGDGGETFRSLSDAEAAEYMRIFEVPDEITPEEVEEDTGFYFVGLEQ